MQVRLKCGVKNFLEAIELSVRYGTIGAESKNSKALLEIN